MTKERIEALKQETDEWGMYLPAMVAPEQFRATHALTWGELRQLLTAMERGFDGAVYAGTREDWIVRCQGAEERETLLRSECDQLHKRVLELADENADLKWKMDELNK